MPGSLHAWYSLYDLQALGEREAHLSGEVELKQLSRLRELLHTDGGSVRASLAFRQHGMGVVTVDLTYEVKLELLCQRCLEPLEHELAERVRLVVYEPESTGASVPPGREPVVLSAGRLQPAALVEDELIVSLPLVPRHTGVEECGRLAHNLEALRAETESGRVSPPPRSH